MSLPSLVHLRLVDAVSMDGVSGTGRVQEEEKKEPESNKKSKLAHGERRWGILPEDVSAHSLNENGKVDDSLPDRRGLRTMFFHRNGLKNNCNLKSAVEDLEDALDGNAALAYVIQEDYDGWAMVAGMTLVNPVSSDCYPDVFRRLLEHSYFRGMNVDGSVGYSNARKDHEYLNEIKNLVSNFRMGFIIDYACTSNSAFWNAKSQNTTSNPFHGLGTLLVSTVAIYVDNHYIQPTINLIEQNAKKYPSNWKNILYKTGNSDFRDRLQSLVRRHAWFFLYSLEISRRFWQYKAGFLQEFGDYKEGSEAKMARLVFPDLETEDPPAESETRRTWEVYELAADLQTE